ncbi:MAG: excinuclease ABC subunit UvrC [Thermaerobacter sp.]|nr:excinuclease ABC subunit C [Bacillota bacterium]
MFRQDLEATVRSLPTRPGVYVFRDAEGDVLYVGKAVNLRNRVRSYFQSPRNLTGKVLHMVNQVDAIEVITTDNDVEALVLESNLIKRYKPPYNIRLRDDKHYPYLKVTVNEAWPRVIIARSVQNDGARYFGPYTDSGALHETLRVIRKTFPYRICSNYRLQQKGRPCLEYYIGRCLAPCDGRADPGQYAAMIEELCDFLEGRDVSVIRQVEARMHEAAERLDFERAAELRDQLRALRQVQEKQKVISGRLEDQDLVGCAQAGGRACVQVFFVREGKVVGREHFLLDGAGAREPGEILAAFIKQYYADTPFIPREILVSAALPADEEAVIGRWLAERRGTRVFLRVPQRGEKRRLMNLVVENARLLLEQEQARSRRDREGGRQAVEDLASALGLETLPSRIECFDISNFQGRQAVGSMVVFQDGAPRKSDYRRFKIRTVQGANDFAMMQEVLYRRFRRGQEEDPRFAQLPDLIVIDGGKGQLNAALEVLRALNLDHIPTIALAKRLEEVYLPGRPDPLRLPDHSPGLLLLRRVRDEAHRFAVTYHRKLRAARSVRSVLDDIPGIGPRRRRALLKHFGSIEAIRSASVEELAAVPGMSRRAAEAVKERL